MIDIVGTAVERLETQQALPSGIIRMTASQNLAVVYLAGAVKRFRERHPRVDIELDAQDSITKLIESGYDIAFRIGWLKSTELHAVKICDFEMVPCAAPSFLEKYGPIRSPMDLSRKPWVTLTVMSDFDRLTLANAEQDDISIKVDPSIRTNSGMTAKQFVLDGAGAGLLPDYAVRAEIENGQIVPPAAGLAAPPRCHQRHLCAPAPHAAASARLHRFPQGRRQDRVRQGVERVAS